MRDVREINDIRELAEYRASWRSLLGKTAGGSFFQSLEWLEVYWRHFGAGQRLRALVVHCGGQVSGIVPLVVRREQTRLGEVRMLTYPLHDWGTFYGPIGPEPQKTLAAGLQYLRGTARDWDVLELRWVQGDGDATQQAMQGAGYPPYKTIWNKTVVVDFSGSWPDYLASRSTKWRGNLHRSQRRLGQTGRVEFVHYRPLGESFGDGAPRWDLYDACETLAGRSWQGASTSGTTLSHESIRPFLRDAHQAAAQAGALDLNLMLLDGRPTAFAYNYHGRGRVDGLRAGYDAQASRDGAGTVLVAHALEQSCRCGDRLYDLGVKSLDWKRHVATRVVPVYRYSYFPWTALRGQLLRVKRSWQARCLAEA